MTPPDSDADGGALREAVRQLAGAHPEVAAELERLRLALGEVAAHVECSVAEHGRAATLSWLGRIASDVERELHMHRRTMPPGPRALQPAPRRRRDELAGPLVQTRRR
jgi:hypothetical protein